MFATRPPLRSVPVLPVLLVVGLLAGSAGAEEMLEIPFEKHVLENGLTVILHQDSKAPVVAVNVWYHVGSKNEVEGRTGFAHLFEHIMFNGSENYDEYYREAFGRVGATGMNGTTDSDRTNYFETVPTTALDLTLFLESDRMGHLLGAVTQEKLDQERGVVQNEKRQREGQPYGKAWGLLTESAYPDGHPYSWSPIGSMEDLTAATLEDVHGWFETWYGPSNAVLSIAGDIDPTTTLEKVRTYFADIPPGPTLTRPGAWPVPMTGSKRIVHVERVPQARLYRTWNTAEFGHADNVDLDLLSAILAEGKTARLYERLVYRDQIATDVTAFFYEREIAGNFVVMATAHPEANLADVEAALEEEMARLLEEGPTEAEVERARSLRRASFIRGIERIGGFGGKSDVLARGQVYGGDPGWYRTYLKDLAGASAESVAGAARTWLADGDLTLEVRPRAELAAVGESIDRSALPMPESFPEARFPDARRGQLDNGLRVLVVERPAVPIVEARMVFDAGYAADRRDRLGTANLALEMLDEGAAGKTALEIGDRLDALGARISSGSNADLSFVGLSALSGSYGASLDVLTDVVLRPDFPEAELARLRREQLAQIGREKVQPTSMAMRVLPGLLYGPDHAYSIPLTGSGTEESVRAIERQDLVRFHHEWFRPGAATFVAVGDTTLEETMELLEGRFGEWEAAPVPEKNVGPAPAPERATVYLLDRPDSEQSSVFAAQLVPGRGHEDDLELEAAAQVLGGSATARLNDNLRRDKHWSYGSFAFLADSRGPRPLVGFAAVQADKTADALGEIAKEMRGIAGERPPSKEEIAETQDRQTLTLPGQWETAGAILRSWVDVLQFDLDDDWWNRYPEQVRALDSASVGDVASRHLDADRLVYVVVGDRAVLEESLRALDLGPVVALDPDGKPMTESVEAAD